MDRVIIVFYSSGFGKVFKLKHVLMRQYIMLRYIHYIKSFYDDKFRNVDVNVILFTMPQQPLSLVWTVYWRPH